MDVRHFFNHLGKVTVWEMLLDASRSKSRSFEQLSCRIWAGFMQKTGFKMDTTPLHYWRTAENCTNGPGTNQLDHALGDEIALHFWKNGIQHEDRLEFSIYQAKECIHLCHLQWINGMSLIPRVERFGFVHGLTFKGAEGVWCLNGKRGASDTSYTRWSSSLVHDV